MHRIVGCLGILLLFSGTIVVSAQDVRKAPDVAASIEQRWDWAVREATRSGVTSGVWIGYSIDRLMGENSWIGRFNSFPEPDEVTLYELVTGRHIEFNDPDNDSIKETARKALSRGETKRPEKKVMKEVAFLFQFRGDPADLENLRTIRITNITLAVDLDRMPLLWLGKSESRESVEFLKKLFSRVTSRRGAEKIIQTVGLHGNVPGVYEFLEEILRGSGTSSNREEAAFWLGMLDTSTALKLLTATALNDESKKVSEKAIFAISQMSMEEATETLIDLGKNAGTRGVRKKAVFWLGQKASKKVVETLQGFVYEDKDEEVQKQAVFALTQLPGDEGVTHIIKIARSHPNPRIRKQAVFWLGQSEDPRAFETIVEIARGK